MSDVTLLVFFLFIVFWVYSIISVYRAKFKEEKQKVFWRIAIVFVPPLAFFYLFMKKNLILK
ncbi:PLDc N-terminal domain-containing protein [Sulfurimonas sp.]|uniref:PLDc N-terminal domain-containing protein n=1 Tax=Sulfurimonas sp. TaxID=2022749 RepID=UPI0025FDFC7A|nr:PLDc N-terminal domain-containing protein [Sulfurimonas sp.]MCK9455604.1 PLDc N-terminal domain-containing protein [Sulfurimonas sp.]